MEKIGFIGLGIMGRGMAHNLLKAGFDVCVWNRSAERMVPLVDAGAAAADSPAELAARSDIILICVGKTDDVQQVVMGDGGVIHGIRPGSLVIDHSTISPAATREIGAALDAKGAHMLDAPISGGSEGAANGTLSIMIGGDEAQMARADGALQAMGSSITHVGPLGSGQLVKAVNQILVVNNMQGVIEALMLAEAADLDLEKTIDAVKGGAAGSWMLSMRAPQLIKRDWRPGFTIDLQTKDLRLVMEAADQLGVPLPSTGAIFAQYRALQRQGLGHLGNHALAKAMEQLAGIEIGQEADDG